MEQGARPVLQRRLDSFWWPSVVVFFWLDVGKPGFPRWLFAASRAHHYDRARCHYSYKHHYHLYVRLQSTKNVAVALFRTLAVGLVDFKVDGVLARLEADFSAQPPSIPAVPNQ